MHFKMFLSATPTAIKDTRARSNTTMGMPVVFNIVRAHSNQRLVKAAGSQAL
jgi:hypothetical protein